MTRRDQPWLGKKKFPSFEFYKQKIQIFRKQTLVTFLTSFCTSSSDLLSIISHFVLVNRAVTWQPNINFLLLLDAKENWSRRLRRWLTSELYCEKTETDWTSRVSLSSATPTAERRRWSRRWLAPPNWSRKINCLQLSMSRPTVRNCHATWTSCSWTRWESKLLQDRISLCQAISDYNTQMIT